MTPTKQRIRGQSLISPCTTTGRSRRRPAILPQLEAYCLRQSCHPAAAGGATTSSRRWRLRCAQRRYRVIETIEERERLRRWRLVLGKPADEPLAGAAGRGAGTTLLGDGDAAMDRVLETLYDSTRAAGLGSSSPSIARWLGDIRTYFPSSVVRVMQQDALSPSCWRMSTPTCTWWPTSCRSARSCRPARGRPRAWSCGR